MSQPPAPYDRQYNFTDYQTANPSAPLPGQKVDQELNAVRAALNDTQDRLGEIQADDGLIRTSALNIQVIAENVEPLLTDAPIQAVEQAGAQQVGLVNAAGDAKVAELEAVLTSQNTIDALAAASAAEISADSAASSAVLAGGYAGSAQSYANSALQSKNSAIVHAQVAQDAANSINLEPYATKTYVTSRGYATQSFVTSQGYLTSSALNGYATESFVTSRGYLISSDLTPYLLIQDAEAAFYPMTGNPSAFIDASALAGYATESFVTGQGYITSSSLPDLSGYMEKASNLGDVSDAASARSNLDVYSKGEVDSAIGTIDLTGYATESFVTGQGYITSAALPDLSGYATQSFVTSQGYIGEAPGGGIFARQNNEWTAITLGDKFKALYIGEFYISGPGESVSFFIQQGLAYTPDQKVLFWNSVYRGFTVKVGNYIPSTGQLTGTVSYVDPLFPLAMTVYGAWDVNLGDDTGEGISEAPQDGGKYVRGSGGWYSLPPSGDRYATNSSSMIYVGTDYWFQSQSVVLETGLSLQPGQLVTISRYIEGDPSFTASASAKVVSYDHNNGSAGLMVVGFNLAGGGGTAATPLDGFSVRFDATQYNFNDFQEFGYYRVGDVVTAPDEMGVRRQYACIADIAEATLPWLAPLNWKTLVFAGGYIGSATADTQGLSDSSAKVATTSFVKSQGYLTQSGNLAGLSSTSVARTNLGLGTMATAATTDYVSTATTQSIAGRKTFSAGLQTTHSASASAIRIAGLSTAITSPISGDVWHDTTAGVGHIIGLTNSMRSAMTAVRAFVNFNGTGTVAIRASFNVSSITDNGVGDYTVNFTTAMADTNYTAHMSGSIPLVAAASGFHVNEATTNSTTFARTTTTFRVRTLDFQGSYIDAFSANVSIFR